VLGILLCPVAALAELAADTIVVNVDQAKLVKLPAGFRRWCRKPDDCRRNPAERRNTSSSPAKGYGATNFIAMDVPARS